MGSFFEELRRRHIYRIGAGYVVVAWAITQVLDVLSQLFALPDWIAQPTVVMLVIGFPVVLAAAWMVVGAKQASEATTANLKVTATDWAMITALIAVLAFMGYQQFASGPQQITSVEAAREAAASVETAVAVAAIPFANLSEDAEQEFFADGITDEISSALARIPDLRVVARQSAYQFKGQNADVQTMGDALGATHLVGGTVRRDGDRLRITANLVDVLAGVEIWSQNFDRIFADVFEIQEEIATAVAEALGMQLGLASGEVLISNREISTESYSEYLRAKALFRSRALDQAIVILRDVVRSNPNYAPAWSLLGLAEGLAPNRDPNIQAGSPDQRQQLLGQARARSEEAITRAVSLDPSNPAVLTTQAYFEERFNGNRTAAEDLYRQALTLDPTDTDILDRLSQQLSRNGRLEEALAIREQITAIEPFVPTYNLFTAIQTLARGPDMEAIELLEATPSEDELLSLLRRRYLAVAYAELGNYELAADTLLRIDSSYIERQVVEAAAEILRSAPDSSVQLEEFPTLGLLSFVFVFVDAPERAMEENEEQLISGPGGFRDWSPAFAELRQTERFKNFIRETGIYDYWLERGFADLCRPVGDNDFECD